MVYRCDKCKKKLCGIEYKCKCERIFCITHLHSEEHNCTFDYKKEAQALIKKQNDIGPLSSKLERI